MIGRYGCSQVLARKVARTLSSTAQTWPDRDGSVVVVVVVVVELVTDVEVVVDDDVGVEVVP